MNIETLPWNPKVILGIINSEGHSFSCMATKADGERCCQPLGQEKKDAILCALGGLSAKKSADSQTDNDKLRIVATNAFCRFHSGGAREGSAIVQWKSAIAAARVSHASTCRLASKGIGNKRSSNSNDAADSVGGSDTPLPSGSSNTSSEDDNDDDDSSDEDDDSDDDDTGHAADDDASDVEVEGLRELLERYKLENRTLRSQLRAATR